MIYHKMKAFNETLTAEIKLVCRRKVEFADRVETKFFEKFVIFKL